ncbi:transglycosylase domain-containing protein [Streptomyces rapamycinicus]|uniref:Penicillin-binding protein n=2 Tax=Streptomyces rapamycinicus TaxID=1226757 RepID=A0A0A0NIF3_STRRN|nr:transglycosylase domain-containing protein [Streptomyces rapamycinicus]AGP56759.1 penicillin-binding protein [Streptomyces rapamycinicus NRRL 5491]MBB4784371.1 membrane peptidoglycan carboxypeptidase [Streptomyces rapamycinicus]RLV80145.1 penicillin-binding protein [Streptomyces rapamycinicus NRRL 5491]UTO64686.1 penicillin-binding protein [Streptomyces rapamycinicus]UTP32642.1 penicillin-binding protein [Streptomyces rapamycinicus NRRL 5491]
MGNTRSSGGLSAAQQAAKFLGVSALAGAVMAGLALPAVGALGLAAKGTVEEFDGIPANLKTPPLSQRTTILDAKGGEIAKVYSRDRTIVELNDISPYMRQAIVAIEDARFYEHGAVDLKGVLRAVNSNAQDGGVSQGASTLTQQYVKNVFVEEAGNDKEKVAQATRQSIGRKIKELKYAIKVEKELGKKRILENYLNITFFGQQAYGIEAASQRYFSKSAKDLKLEQAALLAGLVQSPSRYDPINAPKSAKARRDTVLRRMAEVKDITPAQAAAAQKKPLGLKVSMPRSGCITAVKGAGFFCDYVRETLLNDPTFGKTAEARAKRWTQGGLTIRTTLDPQAQESVQTSIKKHVYQSDPVATAVTLVEPGTGKVLGMGQSRPYGFGENETQINLSADKSMGGSNYGFQVGSTFKPITAAAAIEQGKKPYQRYSSPYKMKYPSPVTTCKGTWSNDEGATVENENEKEVGPYGMKEATAKSVNTYFVQLISDIGVCPVTQMADKMGAKRADGQEHNQVPSVTLGSEGFSPLTMANAYATFANRGVYCSPVFIESITGPGGKKLKVPQSKCSRAMSEKTADTINTLLRGVVEDGTGKQAGLQSRPSAGKTGTTDERRAAWFVGYTPNMAGAVWVGGPGSKGVKMENITIGGVPHDKVYGADTPGPIWKDAMSGALDGKPAPNFVNVQIKDPNQRKPHDGKKPGDHKPGRDRGNDNGDNGGQDNPWPDISLPPDLIGGGNGNGGNGNGNGGWNFPR